MSVPCRPRNTLPSRARHSRRGEAHPHPRGLSGAVVLTAGTTAALGLGDTWIFPGSLWGFSVSVLIARSRQRCQSTLEPSAGTGGSGTRTLLFPPPGLGMEMQTAHVARGTG